MSENDEKKSQTQLQTEIKELKDVFGGVKTKATKKNTENPPFPISLTYTFDFPPSNLDVYGICVQLVLGSLEKSNIKVIVNHSDPPFPSDLNKKIEEEILKVWKNFINKNESSFNFIKIFQWIEANHLKLIRLIPEYLIMYMGEDANGTSTRRYEMKPPASNIPEPSDGVESEDERALEARRLREERKREEEEYLLAEKKKESEKIRAAALAGELDPTFAKPKIASKKEREAEKEARNKQGVRMAKTASKKKKFDPEAAAKLAEARGKK
ncbi:hypothetical protein HDU92_004270 [Lobulomyces angularis]|nr:hypothetical protein HDU92_004270 [Lobulomyces angularis]